MSIDPVAMVSYNFIYNIEFIVLIQYKEFEPVTLYVYLKAPIVELYHINPGEVSVEEIGSVSNTGIFILPVAIEL
jgi:hypothetical protein